MLKTLYSVLGVPPTASPPDIDEAFARAKLRYSKAKLETDETARSQYQAIQQAYGTLSDPDARALYDRKIASAGVRTLKHDPAMYADAMPASTSARNIVIVGAVLLLGSGMWFYYANEKAKAEKQIAERMLQLIETEQQRKADLEEQRQQARSEELRQRVEDAQRRRFEMDSQRAGQMVDAERRRIEAAAAAEERRNAATLLSDERNRESARRQAEGEALRRVADEKRQLREICVQRYRRADC